MKFKVRNGNRKALNFNFKTQFIYLISWVNYQHYAYNASTVSRYDATLTYISSFNAKSNVSEPFRAGLHYMVRLCTAMIRLRSSKMSLCSHYTSRMWSVSVQLLLRQHARTKFKLNCSWNSRPLPHTHTHHHHHLYVVDCDTYLCSHLLGGMRCVS